MCITGSLGSHGGLGTMIFGLRCTSELDDLIKQAQGDEQSPGH